MRQAAFVYNGHASAGIWGMLDTARIADLHIAEIGAGHGRGIVDLKMHHGGLLSSGDPAVIYFFNIQL